MKQSTDRSTKTIVRALSIATLIMAGSNVLSRVLGFVRMQVLAFYGGTTLAVDAYSFSFILPDVINHFLAGSALSITFIPIFQKCIIQGNEKNAWRFFSNLMTIGTLLFVVFIAVSMIFTENILALAGENINNPDNPQQFALALRLTRIILPAQLFFFWGALLNGVQYAKKRFLLPALTPLCYNIGIILVGWLFFPLIGIEGFSWGVLIGAFIGNVAVQIPGALKVGMRFRPVIHFTDSNLIKYVLITIPFIVGISMTFSNEFLFRVFGSFSPNGTGALASLDYSYKIMFILVGLFGQAFAAGFYPFLSQLTIEKKFSEIQRFLSSIITNIGSILIPLTGVMIILSPNIIAVLLQRGVFNAQSTDMTSKAFTYYLLGTFFCAMLLIVNRLYYALQNTIFPMLVSTGTVICCLPLYYYFGKLLGVGGIALASSISMIIQFGIIFGTWSVRYKNIYLQIVLKKLGIIFLVTVFGSLICYGIKNFLYTLNLQVTSVLWRNLIICVVASVPSLLFISCLLEVTGVQNYRKIIFSQIKRLYRE